MKHFKYAHIYENINCDMNARLKIHTFQFQKSDRAPDLSLEAKLNKILQGNQRVFLSNLLTFGALLKGWNTW